MNAKFFKTFTVMGAQAFALAGEPSDKWTNGIFENAYAHCKFLVRANVQTNRHEIEMVLCDRNAYRDGLKFRKISGKTLDEACKKFEAWVDKNSKFFLTNSTNAV